MLAGGGGEGKGKGGKGKGGGLYARSSGSMLFHSVLFLCTSSCFCQGDARRSGKAQHCVCLFLSRRHKRTVG